MIFLCTWYYMSGLCTGHLVSRLAHHNNGHSLSNDWIYCTSVIVVCYACLSMQLSLLLMVLLISSHSTCYTVDGHELCSYYESYVSCNTGRGKLPTSRLLFLSSLTSWVSCSTGRITQLVGLQWERERERERERGILILYCMI